MKQKKVIILTKEEVEVVKKVYSMAEDLYIMDNTYADEEDAMHYLCNFFEDYAFNKDIKKCEINNVPIRVEED